MDPSFFGSIEDKQDGEILHEDGTPVKLFAKKVQMNISFVP